MVVSGRLDLLNELAVRGKAEYSLRVCKSRRAANKFNKFCEIDSKNFAQFCEIKRSIYYDELCYMLCWYAC